MKTRVNIQFCFALLLSLFTSCEEKEDYTLPVDVNMQMLLDQEPAINGLLTVKSVRLNLASIDISGYREVGDDVFLTRDFNQARTFLLTPDGMPEEMLFEIPQGIYNPFFFSFNLISEQEEKEDFIEDIDSWHEDLEEDEESIEDIREELGDVVDDYLEEVDPCLLLEGHYVKNETTYRVYLAIDDTFPFEIEGNNKESGRGVVLDKNNKYKAEMVLKPADWFSAISPFVMNKAFVGIDDDDQQFIFIHKYVNSDIYTSVLNRIEQSTRLNIKE